MNKLSITLSALALFFAVNSHAESDHNPSTEIVTSKQCDYYYQQALAQPLTTRDHALSTDQEKIKEAKRMRQMADEYIMNREIADFPSTLTMTDYETDDELQRAIATEEVFSSGAAEERLIALFRMYFVGDYLPKDDKQAIVYLEKVVTYYEQEQPSHISEMLLGLTFHLTDYLLENESTTEGSDLGSLLSKMLMEAGSIEAKAILRISDLKESNLTCLESNLSKLEELGNQGSYAAIYALADAYKHLDEDNSKKYNDKRIYWQQKAEENPRTGMRWGSWFY